METEVEAKDVQAIMDAIGSSWKRARICEATEVSYSGTFWDGGSKYEYTAVDLVTGRAVTGQRFDPPQFGGPQTTPVVPMVPGVVIVKHGVFCGKPGGVTIYVHPDNMVKLLPAVQDVPELGEPEKRALMIVGGYKSAGRRDGFARNKLGDYGPENEHVKSLAAKGLVKIGKGGVAATLAGDNLRRTFRGIYV